MDVTPILKTKAAAEKAAAAGDIKRGSSLSPNKVRRLSLSEQQIEKASETYGKDIVRFTQRNILRVYPKGIRVDSSNYNPMIGWSHGAQMVAFNMQVGIAGVAADTIMKKTKTLEDNWIPELKKGIRAVPLHDRKGNKYKSVKLLMHFDLV